MRILIASNVYPPNFIGGAELVAHEQAKSLRELGHEVQVFAGETHPFGEHHEIAEDELDGIPVHRISMLPHDYDPRYVNFTHPSVECHFRNVAERFRPDVFHGHNLIGLSAALPRLAKRLGAVSVVTLHDHWGFCFKNTLLKERENVCNNFTRCAECLPTVEDGAGRGIPIRMRTDYLALALSQADALVSPSRYLANAYKKAGFPEESLHVIPYGIDVERFQSCRSLRSPARELRLSFVGGLYPHKGVTTLVKALGHLPEEAPVRVNLVGAGDQRTLCESILKANNRRDWVKFWGKVSNDRIEEVYTETDVLVLPSIWPENQPVSITEAMASGIPAIVSDLGGMPELVDEGATGRIFKAGDSKDLARCIAQFIRDPTLVSLYGEAAKERIQPLSLKSQVRELSILYQSLFDQRTTREIPPRLVVCHGREFGQECARVMAAFPASEGWRFVLREWLDDELARSAWLHWIMADSQQPEDGVLENCREAPLLVSTRNRALLKSLAARRCGLVYHDANQAKQCIKTLDADEPFYNALMFRARRVLGGRRRQ